MRFLDYLFHGKELKAIGNYFKMLNGYSPTFTSFSGGVYEMDLTKLSVSTQLFDRALLNRNGVMDIWNMAHVEDGEKYYIRKEYTEVSELQKGNEPQVVIQQVPQAGEQNPQPETGETQDGQTEKEGVNNAS